MAITVNYQNGGIGGVVSSPDFISGLIYDTSLLPTGFDSNNRIKAVYSVKDAEALGIYPFSINETKATLGAITFTGVTAGDTISLYVTPSYGQKTLIGQYQVKTADTTGTTALNLGVSININKSKFLATMVGGPGVSNTINLSVPVGYGASLNASGLTVEHSKSGVNGITITQFSGGVGAKNDNLHFIISNFFKTNPNSKLWIGIYDFTSAFDSSTIANIQTASGGEIRQLGIYTIKGLDGIQNIVTDCQSVAVDQASKKKPLSIIIGAQAGTATLANLVNLRTLTSPRVSVTISNAYGNKELGYRLKGTTGNFPTDLGQVLGLVSRSKVSNSVAWVANNILQNADSMLVTGEKWMDIEDTTKPQELFSKGYIFQNKYFGYAGSYLNNDSVADAVTSDYESIKRMRTMDKVARQAYFVLVPYLSSPLVINPTTGQISQETISDLSQLVISALNQMATASEISGFSVYIDPSQNVLSTKNIEIAVDIVPIGSADTITLNLGYALSVQ